MVGRPARCGQGEDDAPRPIALGVDEWWTTPPAVGRVKMIHPSLLGRALMNGPLRPGGQGVDDWAM